MNRRIDELIAGRWRDPAGGDLPRLPIERIVIERSLAGGEAEIVAPLGLGTRLAVVADPRTYEALGRRVEKALRAIAHVEAVVLPAPHADAADAEDLIERTRAADALVAVGSGTLNDLCKYAAARTGRPYMVFGTAPSMNGYVTGTASLTVNDLKRTLPARCPRAVVLDLEVLRQAPIRLIRAGLGDVLCRTTAQADWLLAHLLRGTPYQELPFQIQAEDEATLLADPAALAGRELAGIETLTRLLVLSGLGMLLAGSSAPASQAEHLISHYIDMMAGAAQPGSFHGEQVGVATVTTSRLQHLLLQADAPPVLEPTRLDEAALLARYGAELGALCLGELRAKALDAAATNALNRKLADSWPEFSERLRAVMVPTEHLEAALGAVGAPLTGAALGLESGFYREAVRNAREVRHRYTILDLAADAGVLDDFAGGEC